MNRIFFVTFLALAGCATVPVSGVADADEAGVATCQYVGDVQGASGLGGLAAGAGMANAKTAARRQAQALGATHIVWRSIEGGYAPSASGRAYLCR